MPQRELIGTAQRTESDQSAGDLSLGARKGENTIPFCLEAVGLHPARHARRLGAEPGGQRRLGEQPQRAARLGFLGEWDVGCHVLAIVRQITAIAERSLTKFPRRRGAASGRFN